MIEEAVMDLLGFYQKDLRERIEGREALEKLGIVEPEVAEHFSLGYASGRAMHAASEAQYAELKRLGLAVRRGEKFRGCIVIPVYGSDGRLVDLAGVRQYKSGLRYLNWKPAPQGLIGAHRLGSSEDVIICDAPLWALQTRQLRTCLPCALRASKDARGELARHLPLLREKGVRRVYLLTRQQMGLLKPVLENGGIAVAPLQMPPRSLAVTEELLAAMDGPVTRETALRLVSQRGTRLVYAFDEISYTLDAGALTGLSMRVQLKVSRGKVSIMDRLDLASASARRKFARACAARFERSTREFEDELCAVAEAVDELEPAVDTEGASPEREPTEQEVAAANRFLSSEPLLPQLSGALRRHFGVVGEEANRKLAVLVTASRLLSRPLGAIVRGPAGCGKSALVNAAAKLLPASEVLYFSRLTAQALYFMPREKLQHRLLVVDEYEGLQDSEYALRSMMSSGVLSLAITLREGGKVPVTRTVEMDTSLAVLVSTTRTVNIENLSRFIELGMDDSATQTRTVMEGLAERVRGQSREEVELEKVRLALGLLSPCRVRVPFADKLVYSSGNVLARRQYGKLVGLVSAHAALHQKQREASCGGGDELLVEAEVADYAAVYPLLGHVIEHFEAELSPAAVKLLDLLQKRKSRVFTRKQAMRWTGWSYGKTYGVLQELVGLDLLIPDRDSNGVERVFEMTPFNMDAGVARLLPAPEAIT